MSGGSSVGAEVPTSFAAFRELVHEALALCRRGMAAEALGAADRAHRWLPGLEVPSTRDGAEVLNSLGITFFETGYARRAKALYERALAMLDEIGCAEGEVLEDVLNNLGQAEARVGSGEHARSLLERAVALREARAPDSVALGVLLDNLGGVCAPLGDLGRAEALHRRALRIFHRELGPFDTHAATALGNLSTLYMTRREPDRAEAFRLRALDAHLRRFGPAHPESLLGLTQLVEIRFAKGDQAGADRLVGRVLAIGGAQPRREHRFVAEMLSNVARIAFDAFRVDLAERACARAVVLLEALEGPHAPETLAAVHLLGNTERATHDLASAERTFRRALEGYTSLDMDEAAVRVMIDLAKVYRDRGALALAGELLGAVVERLRRDAGGDRQQLVSALGNLAELHYAAGAYALADRTYGEALDAIGDSASEVERPWLLHGRGMLQYHLGRYAQALELYGEAQGVWSERRESEHPFVATTLANLALVRWAIGDVEGALEAFSQSAELRDRDLRRILAVGSERKRLTYAKATLIELDKILSFHFAVDHPGSATARLAAGAVLRRKGRVLDGVAHAFTRVRADPDPEDGALIDRLQVVRTEISALVTPTPLAARAPPGGEVLAGLRQEEEALETALSHRGALLDPDLAPVSIELVQGALPPDGALVEYVRFTVFAPLRTGSDGAWGEEHYAAVVIRPGGDPQALDLGPVAAIDRGVEDLRRLLRRRASDLEACERAARAVSALVLDPLTETLDGVRHLLIAPDGRLALIPFGLLDWGAAGCPSARAEVSYLSTGRELLQLAVTSSSARAVVVVAAPDYDASPPGEVDPATPPASAFNDRGPFPALPETRSEAALIRSLLDEVTVLEGAFATVEAVKRLQRPLVLHIATHGFFSPLDAPEATRRVDWLPFDRSAFLVQTSDTVAVANPMFYSGVALAGANRRAPGTNTGILTAQELAGIDLRATELVVLSACETGLGTVERGEEFIGLRRALSIAGATTQVTSLWRVDDVATGVLMGHFYAALVAGRPRARALAIAQERVAADREHPEWKHPFFWAAFLLSGAWAPIPGGLT